MLIPKIKARHTHKKSPSNLQCLKIILAENKQKKNWFSITFEIVFTYASNIVFNCYKVQSVTQTLSGLIYQKIEKFTTWMSAELKKITQLKKKLLR